MYFITRIYYGGLIVIVNANCNQNMYKVSYLALFVQKYFPKLFFELFQPDIFGFIIYLAGHNRELIENEERETGHDKCP